MRVSSPVFRELFPLHWNISNNGSILITICPHTTIPEDLSSVVFKSLNTQHTQQRDSATDCGGFQMPLMFLQCGKMIKAFH